MKIYKLLFLLMICVGAMGRLQVQDCTQAKDKINHQNPNFVDENNDGYNDNAPDHDGDGIPNGLDPDWQKLQKEKKKGKHKKFVDLNGDGINDNIQNGQRQEGQVQQRKMDGQDGSSIESNQQKGQAQEQKRKGKKN